MTDAEEDRRRLNEQAAVLRAQAGDRAAFGQLVDQYQRRLTYYVHRLVSDLDQAHDLLQEVWIDVFRQLGRLESPAAFRVWLYRIAHHRAVSHLRRTSARSRAHEAAAVCDDAVDDVDELELLENVEWVHHALAQLSVEHREALTLRFLEGMTVSEIAAVTRTSEGTAKSRLHYAKAAMRRLMEKERTGE